ncbi:MAG: DUF1440 domain-containing protein [Dehalococcoidia bacterium]
MDLSGVTRGAVAGAAATAPMTLFMTLAHRALPMTERYPLPPRQVTERASERSGVELPRTEGRTLAVTLLAHFAYGAATGALYGSRPPAAVPKKTLAAAVDGALFGLVVWDVSYLGLLPALGLLPPATLHPWRRNALMISAHIVWGGSLGAILSLRDASHAFTREPARHQ